MASNRPPRDSLQDEEVEVPCLPGGHPCGLTTHVCWPAVDGRTRAICSGLPTRKANEDHVPSSPSLPQLLACFVGIEEAKDAKKQ